MELLIYRKEIYGQEKIYPACPVAEKFVKLLEQKTFTRSDILQIMGMGIKITEVSQPRESLF